VTIAIERRRHAASDVGYRQTFHHFALRGFERDGEFLLVSRRADTRVEKSGRSIVLRVARGADLRRVANTDLFIALTIALRHHGLFHMHAGAVVRADGTRVLIAGDSGSGKSTVTLGLLEPGANYLGDDALFLMHGLDGIEVLAFPRPFHLGPATLEAFPLLRCGASAERVDGKHDVAMDVLDVTGARPIARMAAPQVLLFPRVTRAASTRSTGLIAADAFGALLRASAFAIVDGMPAVHEHVAILGDVARSGRAYELAHGRDWLARGSTVRSLAPLDACPT
jgi:hypothetical protein